MSIKSTMFEIHHSDEDDDYEQLEREQAQEEIQLEEQDIDLNLINEEGEHDELDEEKDLSDNSADSSTEELEHDLDANLYDELDEERDLSDNSVDSSTEELEHDLDAKRQKMEDKKDKLQQVKLQIEGLKGKLFHSDDEEDMKRIEEEIFQLEQQKGALENDIVNLANLILRGATLLKEMKTPPSNPSNNNKNEEGAATSFQEEEEAQGWQSRQEQQKNLQGATPSLNSGNPVVPGVFSNTLGKGVDSVKKLSGEVGKKTKSLTESLTGSINQKALDRKERKLEKKIDVLSSRTEDLTGSKLFKDFVNKINKSNMPENQKDTLMEKYWERVSNGASGRDIKKTTEALKNLKKDKSLYKDYLNNTNSEKSLLNMADKMENMLGKIPDGFKPLDGVKNIIKDLLSLIAKKLETEFGINTKGEPINKENNNSNGLKN